LVPVVFQDAPPSYLEYSSHGFIPSEKSDDFLIYVTPFSYHIDYSEFIASSAMVINRKVEPLGITS
jgi:hypothetical protein